MTTPYVAAHGSLDESERDVQAAIGVDCSSVARNQCQSMLHGHSTDEGVVHCSAGDAERAEPGQQVGSCVTAQEMRGWQVVGQETGDRARSPSRRRWQTGEDGERLKRGVPGQAEDPVANRIDNGSMVLVICHDERDGDAGVDQ